MRQTSKIPHPDYVSSPLKRKLQSSPESENISSSLTGEKNEISVTKIALPPAKKQLVSKDKGVLAAIAIPRPKQQSAVVAAEKPTRPDRLAKRIARPPTATAPPVRSTAAKRPAATTASATESVTRVAESVQQNNATLDSAEQGADLPKNKKRPAWDTKGRLEDMEKLTQFLRTKMQSSDHTVVELACKLESSASRVNELEEFRHALENQVQIKQQENTGMSMQLSQLQSELEMTKREYAHTTQMHITAHEAEVGQLSRDKTRLEQENSKLTIELKSANESVIYLQGTISRMKINEVEGESRMRALENKLASAENTIESQRQIIATRDSKISNQSDTIQSLENKVQEDEMIRRKLHNVIQELKGNIRVFCRVRPLLSKELEERDQQSKNPHICYPDDQEDRAISLEEMRDSADGTRTVAKSYPFTFDKVFQPVASQTQVFDEISQLVQSALDGYNVCIFAYGQTGSGKTFTMEGSSNDEFDQNMGMIPRAVKQIYNTVVQLQEKGWQYTMEGQFMEIYNEQIRDLLGDGSIDNKHEIRHVNNKTTVTDMTIQILESADAVQSLLKKASKNRAVAATNMNERSSRSHSVFILTLTGKNDMTGEACEGRINLVDLAGSERLSSSGSTGDRLKETQAINKSLSCLGDVIQALANKDSHVPYRNSKLTYLLQNSLGGNSKTLMFVNVSPLAASFNESLNSLRFATKVNSCQIGTAKKAVK